MTGVPKFSVHRHHAHPRQPPCDLILPTPHQFDHETPVRQVILVLMRAALPRNLHASIPRLVEDVTRHEDVAPHVDRRWGELTIGEGGVLARQVRVTARRALTVPGPPYGRSSHWLACSVP